MQMITWKGKLGWNLSAGRLDDYYAALNYEFGFHYYLMMVSGMLKLVSIKNGN